MDSDEFAAGPGCRRVRGAGVVVDPDGQAVYACLTGARRRAGLLDREPRELALVVDLEVGGQGVQAGGLEPL
ncbi:Uncharacterised protein [Mycobacteroides abscessus subsp. abscessus]|nr:Uncharacterised protein [Mycobacteroides abscessus subsp. abscessus]